MVKGKLNIEEQCRGIISDVRKGIFKPVYLLMGDEPYYPELVFREIVEHCIPEEDRDFNQTVCYGADVTADQIVTAARRFPMMAERQLVAVKEAQLMKDIDNLEAYCEKPLDSTVLVILMHKASADRGHRFYKSVQKIGAVVDSPAIRDYEISDWISMYFAGRGLKIIPQAAAMLGESAGTELSTIVIETEKLLKNLPENEKNITAEDIEKNVGISRQYNIFELTRELSSKNAAAALKIAAHLGTSAKFAMPMAVSALFNHFFRILKFAAAAGDVRYVAPADKPRVYAGIKPFLYREYDAAMRNYSVRSAMAVISLLCEYDYLGKGGDGGAATPDELIVELTAKILNT